MANELVATFMKIGLTEQRAKETAKNEALSLTLRQLIIEVSIIAAGTVIL
jgi:Glutaminyl-tRNA synthetase, non-specific RNA binding region part 1